MRIISGKFGGVQLFAPKSGNVRPTTDKVKGAIFNILANKAAIHQARVLDLFCGSGALGLEALSRGADEVVFVDSDHKSVALTQQNLYKIKAKAKVVCCDFKTAIKNFGQNLIKFDLILLDPPYNRGIELIALKEILTNNILQEGGCIAIESAKGVELGDICTQRNLSLSVYEWGGTVCSIVSNLRFDTMLHTVQ